MYNEVVEQQKLRYTLGDGRECLIEFSKNANGTRVTTVFDAERQNPVDMQRNGWQAILNNFKAYTENH